MLVLPHFTTTGTPHFDNHSRGAIMGLTLDTTRQDIVRAVLEGITYELRMCIDLLDEAGVPVDELRATGGGAKSAPWLQIKADIMNRESSFRRFRRRGVWDAPFWAASPRAFTSRPSRRSNT